MPRPFRQYVGLEAEAAEMLNYQPLFIPGLLQSPGYARAMLLADLDADPAKVEEMIQVRIERQKRLTAEENPLTLHAIVDEAALNRQVGGRQVMAEQFKHLIKMAALPNVTIRFVEFEVGAYPCMGVPFALLSFADDLQVVYLEQQSSALFLEAPGDVDAPPPGRESNRQAPRVPRSDTPSPAVRLSSQWLSACLP